MGFINVTDAWSLPVLSIWAGFCLSGLVPGLPPSVVLDGKMELPLDKGEVLTESAYEREVAQMKMSSCFTHLTNDKILKMGLEFCGDSQDIPVTTCKIPKGVRAAFYCGKRDILNVASPVDYVSDDWSPPSFGLYPLSLAAPHSRLRGDEWGSDFGSGAIWSVAGAHVDVYKHPWMRDCPNDPGYRSICPVRDLSLRGSCTNVDDQDEDDAVQERPATSTEDSQGWPFNLMDQVFPFGRGANWVPNKVFTLTGEEHNPDGSGHTRENSHRQGARLGIYSTTGSSHENEYSSEWISENRVFFDIAPNSVLRGNSKPSIGYLGVMVEVSASNGRAGSPVPLLLRRDSVPSVTADLHSTLGDYGLRLLQLSRLSSGIARAPMSMVTPDGPLVLRYTAIDTEDVNMLVTLPELTACSRFAGNPTTSYSAKMCIPWHQHLSPMSNFIESTGGRYLAYPYIPSLNNVTYTELDPERLSTSLLEASFIEVWPLVAAYTMALSDLRAVAEVHVQRLSNNGPAVDADVPSKVSWQGFVLGVLIWFLGLFLMWTGDHKRFMEIFEKIWRHASHMIGAVLAKCTNGSRAEREQATGRCSTYFAMFGVIVYLSIIACATWKAFYDLIRRHGAEVVSEYEAYSYRSKCSGTFSIDPVDATGTCIRLLSTTSQTARTRYYVPGLAWYAAAISVMTCLSFWSFFKVCIMEVNAVEDSHRDDTDDDDEQSRIVEGSESSESTN